jgi:Tol biopolymer transport system component
MYSKFNAPSALRTGMRRCGSLVACTALAAMALSAAPSSADEGSSKAPRNVSVTRLISKTAAGEPADANSSDMALPDDCTVVAFESRATNLSTLATNGALQVYARSRGSKEVILASVNSAGEVANSSSPLETISGNGRFVVFRSDATNLVGPDPLGVSQIYVHNLVNGRTRLASADDAGNPSNGSNGPATISADGRYVTFRSFGSNLVGGDTNDTADVFVRDLLERTTIRVSVDLDGGQLSSGADSPVMSSDGRFVAFRTVAPLVPEDSNDEDDIYRVTRSGEHLALASAAENGTAMTGIEPAISATGRYVVFRQDAIVRHDFRTGKNESVSIGYDGAEVPSYNPVISADGDRVAYASDEANLVRHDTNGDADIFLTTVSTGKTVRASVGTRGTESDGSTEEAAISGNGWCVAFSTNATTFGPQIPPGTWDVFLRRLVH